MLDPSAKEKADEIRREIKLNPKVKIRKIGDAFVAYPVVCAEFWLNHETNLLTLVKWCDSFLKRDKSKLIEDEDYYLNAEWAFDYDSAESELEESSLNDNAEPKSNPCH